MDFESLGNLVRDYEKKHQPALVNHVLDTLKQGYSGEDVNDELRYNKWFIKGVRLIYTSIDKGLNLQHYGWKTPGFSNQDLDFFYNYAELGILSTEKAGVWEEYGRKAIKNMRAHLFTDKARLAKKLAESTQDIQDKMFWLDQGIIDCLNGITWSLEFDQQHRASQFCLKGELEINLAEIVKDPTLKIDLLEQAYQDYREAWNSFKGLKIKDIYIAGFLGYTAQQIADLVEGPQKKRWLELAISGRDECAKQLEFDDPVQSSTHYGFKAQAEINMASIVPSDEAKKWLEQSYSDYSTAISLANKTNRVHEAHLFSFRADTARKRAELTQNIDQYIFWKSKEYQDNILGATKSKHFNEEHSAITFVNAGRAAAEIYELGGSHLDEAISSYSAFVNYFQRKTPAKYHSLFNKITCEILPSLQQAKNPSKRDPDWKIKRRMYHKLRQR